MVFYQSLPDCDRQPSLRLKFNTTFILNAFMYILFIFYLLLKYLKELTMKEMFKVTWLK